MEMLIFIVVAVTSIFPVPYAHICLLSFWSHFFLSRVNHLYQLQHEVQLMHHPVGG